MKTKVGYRSYLIRKRPRLSSLRQWLGILIVDESLCGMSVHLVMLILIFGSTGNYLEIKTKLLS